MQLVPSDIHAQTGHTGGAAMARAVAGGALAAVAGDTAAEIMMGDKAATNSNLTMAVGDFVLNLLPVVFGINDAGKDSDKVWRDSDQKKIETQER